MGARVQRAATPQPVKREFVLLCMCDVLAVVVSNILTEHVLLVWCCENALELKKSFTAGYGAFMTILLILHNYSSTVRNQLDTGHT